MSGRSGSVAAFLPWLGAGMTGGLVYGVVSPAPKRIWLFGQSRGQFTQVLRIGVFRGVLIVVRLFLHLLGQLPELLAARTAGLIVVGHVLL